MANGTKQPLTFWQTVGANMVGGIITGAVSTLVVFVGTAIVAKSASREAIQQLRQEGVLPPVAEG